MRLHRVVPLAIVVASVTGCATKSYVDEHVARLESRQDEQAARIDELSETSRQALERANDAGHLAQGKFLYTVVLTDDEISFESNESELSDGAQLRLAGLAGDLLEDNSNVYVEIQGHTDATGPAEYNQYLGLQRAEAARLHLHRQGVALDRMATISYGEEAPAGDNSTSEGRALNRRVEVVVLQ